MSTWLAKALAARAQPVHATSEACANSANSAKTPADPVPEGGSGTNGTIGTASNIPEEEIRSRFGWIKRRLVEEHGRDLETAQHHGLSLLKAQLLNDLRLAPLQDDPHRCFVCGGVGTPLRVLVPVLTAWPDNRLWLHLEPCHAEHRRRRSEEADALLRWALSPTTMRADRGENQTKEGEGQNSPPVPLRTGAPVSSALQFPETPCKRTGSAEG